MGLETCQQPLATSVLQPQYYQHQLVSGCKINQKRCWTSIQVVVHDRLMRSPFVCMEDVDLSANIY